MAQQQAGPFGLTLTARLAGRLKQPAKPAWLFRPATENTGTTPRADGIVLQHR
jgi:hypothetical protein